MFPHRNCEYILYTKIVQDLYNWCIQNVYNIYVYHIFDINVYHILASFCIHFVNKIKRTMSAKFCVQNVYKSLSKCRIHFVYKHFVYITKCIQKFVEIWDTFCMQTFCIYLYTSIQIYEKCTS